MFAIFGENLQTVFSRSQGSPSCLSRVIAYTKVAGSFTHRASELEQPVGKGALPVVHMRNNREVSNQVPRSHLQFLRYNSGILSIKREEPRLVPNTPDQRLWYSIRNTLVRY